MKQTWHGRSAFRIEAGEAKILIDPFRDHPRSSVRTRGLPNAHEGEIHAPKESLDVEHDYAVRFLSHA